ncbi:MAG TPA: hypothetical protein VK688_04220, partial [Gemmatimonadales bacterium]|nr:hypothetical protein [Gemmatimonadales bacterium]
MGSPPRMGRFSSTQQPSRISQPASHAEREQQQIEEDIERREQAKDDAAFDYQPRQVELSPRERAREEAEKRAMLDALRDTRPSRPAPDATAPEQLNPRVKPAPEPLLEVEAVEPVVPVPDAQLAEATARQLEAQARV